MDEKGNERYAIKWNTGFSNVPVIEIKARRKSCTLTQLVSNTRIVRTERQRTKSRWKVRLFPW